MKIKCITAGTVSLSVAFCASGLLLGLLAFGLYPGSNVFARQNQSTSTGQAEENVAMLQAMPTQEVSSVPVVSITPLEDNGQIDMAALDMHPTPASLGSGPSFKNTTPDGAAIGTGKAFLGITHEIVNQNTANAFGTLSSGWTAGESVQFYLNGNLAGTFVASAGGSLAVGISTGSGFGYITVDEIGLTSGKETGGVLHVASTGPYLPGVTAAPHAINTSAGGSFLLCGSGYPASSTVNLYRNGAIIGTASTNSSGKYLVGIIPGNNGNTSAVYSSDNGTPGSMAGITVEERTDAGTPPVGDQNSARAFLDHAMLLLTGGSTWFSLVGEGFQPGETVTLSGSASGSFPANVNGAAAFFLRASPSAGVYSFVLTGGASGRIARATALAHPNVTNLRGLIVAPAFVNPGGNVLVMADNFPANNTGNIYLDGVLQGTATTDASGIGTFILNKPASGFVHAVSWIATNGNGNAESAVLLLGPPGPTPTPTPSSTPTATPFSCVPETQGFDDITTLPGSGWVQINHSQPGPGITNWFQGSTAAFTSQSGAPNSYIAANYDNGTGTSTLSNWLLTQPVGLQNGFMLTFWTRTVTGPALPDRLQVRMSTNGNSTNVGTTATDVGDFTTLLLDINPTYTTSGYPNVWTQFTVPVTGVPTMTTGRLAFRYFVENGGPNGANSDYVGIDTVQYDCNLATPTASPAPPTPTPSPTSQPIPTPILLQTPPQQCDVPPLSITVSLPVATIAPSPSGVVLIPVTTSLINSTTSQGANLIGFQGDFTFDSSVITFAIPFVQRGGLTSDPNWNINGSILGTGTIKTMRISAFMGAFVPLAGSGTLFNLRVQSTNTTGSTPLIWANCQTGSEFEFIDDNLNAYDATTPNGQITITGTTPPTPTPTPTLTPTPTPIKISGTVSYCPNPVPGPVPSVTLNITGSALASTISDDSGNYQVSILSNGGTYTVTPTKAARPSGSANINTVDVIATQQHFLSCDSDPSKCLSGCRLAAADVNGDLRVDTVDVTAIQRFSLGQTTGIANTGKYRFIPANRIYTNITTDQTGQNYNAFIFGDVASHFVEPIATAIPTPTPH